MTVTYSVTRALAELKRIDDRIARQTSDSTFIAAVAGKNDKQKLLIGSEASVSAAETKIKSNMQSILDMFAQRQQLKAAIVLSNATTKVTIAGQEMTVAEAIELKTSIAAKQKLILVLKNQLNNVNSIVTNQNSKLEQQIEANLATIYGSDKSKIDKDTYDTVAKPQKDAKEASLLDPLGIVNLIAKLEEEVSEILTNLDFTLSESNAKTEITIQ